MVRSIKKPLVSVIIPTYKRRNKLKRAMKSVLNQTYPCVEIIVVNDDPSTNIEDIVNVPEEVIVVNHNENKGPSGARNTGLKIAKGKYIAFLDDDDYFLPKKLEEEVEIMEKLSEEWVAVYSWFISSNQNGTKKVIKSHKEGDLTYGLLAGDKSLRIGTPSLLVNSEAIKSLNGFDESLTIHEDWDMFIRLLKIGNIKLLPKALWIRDKHERSNVNQFHEGKMKFLQKYEKKIEQLGKKNKNKILQNHFLDISYLYFKDKRYKKGIRYFKKSLQYIYPKPNYLFILKVFIGLIEGSLKINIINKI